MLFFQLLLLLHKFNDTNNGIPIFNLTVTFVASKCKIYGSFTFSSLIHEPFKYLLLHVVMLLSRLICFRRMFSFSLYHSKSEIFVPPSQYSICKYQLLDTSTLTNSLICMSQPTVSDFHSFFPFRNRIK